MLNHSLFHNLTLAVFLLPYALLTAAAPNDRNIAQEYLDGLAAFGMPPAKQPISDTGTTPDLQAFLSEIPDIPTSLYRLLAEDCKRTTNGVQVAENRAAIHTQLLNARYSETNEHFIGEYTLPTEAPYAWLIIYDRQRSMYTIKYFLADTRGRVTAITTTLALDGSNKIKNIREIWDDVDSSSLTPE